MMLEVNVARSTLQLSPEPPRNHSSAAIRSHYPTVTYRRQKWICLCKNNGCGLRTALKEN